ncbi:hypothetical protein [Lacihabitans sp. CS3-21]|uniref:PKD domain-containing protein n=1 Tax=Lacihabitans sp. CS3-21 TaxID=2487332 RepID=UPI0020CEFB77|nr:hypothetical protein [Lacihabitans sp. CS3-21]
MRLLIGMILFSNLVLGQSNVCLFTNKPGSEESKKLLIEKAKLFNINLIEVHNLEKLNEFEAVFFLDFDESKLSIKDNSALVSFFKNGGGALGAFDIQTKTTNRIWFEQMFGKLENPMPEKKDLDLIPVQDLNNMGLSPLWKTPSAEFVNLKVPKYLKAVLMNLEGRAVSWSGVSELSNKVYYTALKLNLSSIQNQDFFKSLVGGIKSVVSTKKDSNIEPVVFPEIKDFRVLKLAEGFQNARALEYFSPTYCIILTEKGELFNYNSLSKETSYLGLFESLSGALDITADPEFGINGYFYFYFDGDKSTVKRVKMLDAKKAELDDFILESSMPVKNTFISNVDSSNIGMAKYYQGKQFSVSKIGNIEVSTLNADQQVIDVEPFVVSFEAQSLKGIAQKENGEMLVMMKDSLNLIQYKFENGFPPFVNFTFKNLSLKPPYKVEFDTNIDEGYNFEWEISGKKLVGKKVIQVFKTAGDYPIKLRATNAKGQTDFILKTIKIEKAITLK